MAYNGYSPNLDWNTKRFLLDLNRDLDLIKDRVQLTQQFGFIYKHSINRDTSDLSELERSVLYLEDRRFFKHNGVELWAIPRAIRRFLRGRGVGGISTIDQQVVRISTLRTARNIDRKFRELLLAFAINHHIAKRDILYFYLHEAYLGYRLTGCEMAANHIFRKSAQSLDFEQASFLASLFALPLPKRAYEVCATGDLGVSCHPNDLIDHAALGELRWTGRVRYRYSAALRGQDFMPNRR